MTSAFSPDVREVIFINERCRLDYESMPGDVKESADQAISALQNGRSLPSKMHRPLKGKLAGASEIRLPYDTDTFRVYLTLQSSWVLMILDAGMKKSTEGNNIPKVQRERLEERFKKSREYCKENDVELRDAYDMRQERRDTIERKKGP